MSSIKSLEADGGQDEHEEPLGGHGCKGRLRPLTRSPPQTSTGLPGERGGQGSGWEHTMLGCAGLEGGPPPLQNEVLKTHMGEEQRKTPGGEVGNHPEPRAQRPPTAGAGLLRTPDRDPGT